MQILTVTAVIFLAKGDSLLNTEILLGLFWRNRSKIMFTKFFGLNVCD